MLRPPQEQEVLNFAAKPCISNLLYDHAMTTKKYLRNVSTARQSLYSASLLFSGTHTVLPIHCNEAINSLEEISELTQAFCEYLRPTLSISHTSSAAHLVILSTLYEIKKRAGDLSDLINSYIPAYRQPHASFAVKQRNSISRSLEVLLQHLAELLSQAGQLKEEGDVLDRKVSTASLVYLADYQNKRA